MKALEDHIRQLCHHHGIKWVHAPPGVAVAVGGADMEIHTPAPGAPNWYASAMHEIGHLLSVQPADVWSREVNAWEWAIKHSTRPALRELAVYSLECLNSYHEGAVERVEQRALNHINRVLP